MSTQIAQTERDIDVIDRLRRDADETLDRLGAELSETFPAYRERLGSLVDTLPEWAEPTPDEIRGCFELDSDLTDEEAWLGPQLVGVAAGRVEAFMSEWFASESSADSSALAPSQVETFDRASRDLQMWLAQLEEVAYEQYREARERLDDELQATLRSLEEEREERFEALQTRICDGDIESGEDEQDEKARIWDEQRRRAEAIRDCWRDLYQLLDDGYTYAASQLEELATLVLDLHETLEETYDELSSCTVVDSLRDRIEGRDLERDHLDDELADITPDETNGNEPNEAEGDGNTDDATEVVRSESESGEAAPPTQPALEGMEDDSGGGFARDPLEGTEEALGSDPLSGDFPDTDDGDPLAPASNPVTPESNTPESDTALDAVSDSGTEVETGPETGGLLAFDESAPESASDRGNLASEGDPGGGSEGAEEPPAPSSSSSADTGESHTRPLGNEAFDAPGDSSPPSGTSESPSAPELPETRSEIGVSPPRGSESEDVPIDPSTSSEERSADVSDPLEPSDATEPESSRPRAPSSSPEVSRENTPSHRRKEGRATADDAAEAPLESQCLRIQGVWKPLGFSAIALALGPPLAVLAGLVGMSLLHLAGAPGIPNPVRAWSWVEPVAAVAVFWCLCAPMIMGWRPRWRGWSFDLVHEVERREECALEVGPDQLRLGDHALAWREIRDVERTRWGEPAEDVFGWQVTIQPSKGSNLDFITREFDVQNWQGSSTAIVEPATDAWQVDPEVIEAITRRAPSADTIETDLAVDAS